MECDASGKLSERIVFPEGLGGFGAVKANGANRREGGKKGDEIVGGFIADGSVQTAVTAAGINGIPKGNVVDEQQRQPIFVARRDLVRSREQTGDERPESILRMGVVLTGF